MILSPDLYYFPPISYFKRLYEVTHINFNLYNPYRRMSFFNRAIVVGPNNLSNLSIPLISGRHQEGPLREVRMGAGGKWQIRHWRTLESYYGRSPWFDGYRESLLALYAKPFEFLPDWNLACMHWVLEQLHLPIHISASAFPDLIAPADQIPAVYRKELNPRNYRDFPSPRYRQVFEDRLGFQPNLSILDLLFCEGPAARKLLDS
jgi:hypothetical protein